MISLSVDPDASYSSLVVPFPLGGMILQRGLDRSGAVQSGEFWIRHQALHYL
jgi:hypothetical protein